MISPSTLTYLRDLAANNDRDWFKANKPRYEAARENVAGFADELLERLRKTDLISTQNGKKALFRIYRDVRFSKNKLPYKVNMGGSFTRDGLARRGGYYFSIQPDGQSVVGGGFYAPESKDLRRIREELGADAGALRELLRDANFQRIFQSLRGDKLKTAPQGYPRDHPNIDLLNHKQFFALREFTDKEVTDPNFIDRAEECLLTLRPFFDYFSLVLTTDANGETLL